MNRDRLGSMLGVALVHLLLGYALVTGLAFEAAVGTAEALRVFAVASPPPPAEEPPPPPARSREREGAAAPQGRKARPSPVAAPRTERRASPLPAAPRAGTGSETNAGAAATGPGTGAGGIGQGSGSGGRGDGPGAGAAGPPRLLRGRIVNADYPRSAWRGRAGGTVVARLAIGADGRVTGCTVTRSSGHAELDATTCALIQRRFRYAPARDRAGNPVASVTGWRQRWWLERGDRDDEES